MMETGSFQRLEPLGLLCSSQHFRPAHQPPCEHPQWCRPMVHEVGRPTAVKALPREQCWAVIIDSMSTRMMIHASQTERIGWTTYCGLAPV